MIQVSRDNVQVSTNFTQVSKYLTQVSGTLKNLLRRKMVGIGRLINIRCNLLEYPALMLKYPKNYTNSQLN